jgi:hypothetical protein
MAGVAIRMKSTPGLCTATSNLYHTTKAPTHPSQMRLTNRLCFDDHSLYWLSISEGVRINQNGFWFFDIPVYMPSAQTYPCPRTLDGLCQHKNYTFLPCTPSPRTPVTDAEAPFDRFWRSEVRCEKVPSMFNFDIMPCDLHHGTSIVLSNGKVSVQYDLDLEYWSNLAVLLITLWLIINLGECIVRSSWTSRAQCLTTTTQ